MSNVNKGFELEKRDITNEIITALNKSWLPSSTKAEILANVSNRYMQLANQELKAQEKAYEEAMNQKESEQ